MVVQTDPYGKRLNAWLAERFPPVNFISGTIIHLLAKAIVALSEERSLTWHLVDIAGCLIPALHLFLLRVFDEHKDFKTDLVHYPHRIVQRGVFTLREIRKLGFVAFALQVISFAAMQPTIASIAFFISLWLWTLLMTKEFFVGERLKKHLFLYALLHQLVTPLLLLVLLSLAASNFVVSTTWVFACVLSVFTGALYELSRKIKGQEEETKDLSYSQIWGVKGSLVALSTLTLVTAVIIAFFFAALGLNHFGYRIGLVAVLILSLITHFGFASQVNAKSRKKNEGVAALISAYGFLVPVLVAVFR